MFVNEIAKGNDGAAAVIAAKYNPTTKASAKNMAYEIMQRERVQNALAEKLEDAYPDLEADIAEEFKSRIKGRSSIPLKTTCPSCSKEITVDIPMPSMNHKDFVSMVTLLAKIKGFMAPTKSAHLDVKTRWDYPKE